MKRIVIILLLFIFVICLILGLSLGGNFAKQLKTTAPELPTQTQPEITSNQRTILFIVADNMKSQNPVLESVFVIFYIPNIPRALILSLYPTDQNVSEQAIKLPATFSLKEDLSPSNEFINTIAQYNFSWNGYILTDEVGVASMIDWVGGIDKDGIKNNGDDIVEQLIHPWKNPKAAAEEQRKIISGICNAYDGIPKNKALLDLFATLIPDHLSTDLSAQMIIADWKQILTNNSRPICEFAIP